MPTPPTTRLYLQDSHCCECDARIVAVHDNSVAFDQSCFYPGGGGQPADLLWTLDAKPPVSQGQVRVVEIRGFDAQACGGTHVSATSEVGRFSIFRTENKGKMNKRLYVRLGPAEPRVVAPKRSCMVESGESRKTIWAFPVNGPRRWRTAW
jgi:Ser-tRNA(Ala) deacylase AlaX